MTRYTIFFSTDPNLHSPVIAEFEGIKALVQILWNAPNPTRGKVWYIGFSNGDAEGFLQPDEVLKDLGSYTFKDLMSIDFIGDMTRDKLFKWVTPGFPKKDIWGWQDLPVAEFTSGTSPMYIVDVFYSRLHEAWIARMRGDYKIWSTKGIGGWMSTEQLIWNFIGPEHYGMTADKVSETFQGKLINAGIFQLYWHLQ